MIKLLGIFDILASATLFLSLLNLKWNAVLVIFIIYLLVKGIVFILKSFDIASFIDIFSAAVMCFMLFFSIPQVLILLTAVLLAQKGILSLF